MLLIDTKNLNNSINNILTINNMHLFRLKNSYIITNPNMIYEKKLISDRTYHCVKEKIIKDYELI